jgi:hypothetical protein
MSFPYSKDIQAHILGSYRPEGDPGCLHKYPDGRRAVVRNDDTMGGIGSYAWTHMCEVCGKTWRDD